MEYSIKLSSILKLLIVPSKIDTLISLQLSKSTLLKLHPLKVTLFSSQFSNFTLPKKVLSKVTFVNLHFLNLFLLMFQN